MADYPVADFLGGTAVFSRGIASDLELAREVEAGFPAEALEHVMRQFGAVYEPRAVYAVIGNARTLQRKRKAGTRLSRDESDRLARLGRLHARAVEALGSETRARAWFTRPNRALEGLTPLQVVGSDAGAQLVEQILGRAEHGVAG